MPRLAASRRWRPSPFPLATEKQYIHAALLTWIGHLDDEPWVSPPLPFLRQRDAICGCLPWSLLIHLSYDLYLDALSSYRVVSLIVFSIHFVVTRNSMQDSYSNRF